MQKEDEEEVFAGQEFIESVIRIRKRFRERVLKMKKLSDARPKNRKLAQLYKDAADESYAFCRVLEACARLSRGLELAMDPNSIYVPEEHDEIALIEPHKPAKNDKPN